MPITQHLIFRRRISCAIGCYGFYWYVLADGALLFNHYCDDDRARGIYRYNPDAQAYTLLLENALSLWIEDSTP